MRGDSTNGGTEPFTGPDLHFLERISVPFDGNCGRVIDQNGRAWNLNVPNASAELVVSLTCFLAVHLSVSANSATRQRVNTQCHHCLRMFLEFAAERPVSQQSFNTGLLEAYKRHLYKTFAAHTAYNRYGQIRRAVFFLVKTRAIPGVAVPRNKAKRQVQATIRSGTTFATVFTGVSYADANAANEDLLGKLRDLLWEEIEAMQDRPDIGRSAFASNAFMACAMALLATACVNPVSISDLEIEDLRPDGGHAAMRRLHFHKGRVHADVDLPPFPVGGANARTLPRLWERVIRVTEPMREQASPELRGRLLLRYTRAGTVSCYSDDARTSTALTTLRKLICGGYPTASGAGKDSATRTARTFSSPDYVPSATAGQERYRVIRTNAERITYTLIRNTAINVANTRLRRNSGLTQETIGHKPGGGTLENAYLNNAQYREDLDHEIRRGVAFLEHWARQVPRMLPPDPQAIAASIGVDAGTAELAAADGFNLGMGASLVNGQTVVIDTPLNALRMIQWIEKIQASEERMLRDNPVRWRQVYEPQLSLFQQALHDFSYPSRQEAHLLSEQMRLPFPEVL